MNFSRPGWLGRYLKIRKEHPFSDHLPSKGVKVVEDAGHHHLLDEAVYYFLQPTGLLYGFPISPPFPDLEFPEKEFMNSKDTAHLIFLESLFACLVADRAYLLDGLVDEPDHFAEAVATAIEFFSGLAKHRQKRERPLPWGRWWKGNTQPGRMFEKEIGRRIGGVKDFFQLPGFHHNAFLFLDIYSCLLWQRKILMDPDSKEAYLSDLRKTQAEERRQLIRLMIAAAISGGGIGRAERKLIEWFLGSSRLPRADCAILRKEMKDGLRIEDVQIGETPWLVRRFFLEAVMMTMLIDRDLSASEEHFLTQVVELLGLWEDELQQGMMALEVFLLQKEDSLQILKDRSFVFNLGENLRERASLVVRKNMKRVVNEIHETQDLYNLLIKSTKTGLTSEEKERVKSQLSDILKTIPALAIFALPGGAILLPILIKLLPFNLLPSSFED